MTCHPAFHCRSCYYFSILLYSIFARSRCEPNILLPKDQFVDYFFYFVVTVAHLISKRQDTRGRESIGWPYLHSITHRQIRFEFWSQKGGNKSFIFYQWFLYCLTILGDLMCINYLPLWSSLFFSTFVPFLAFTHCQKRWISYIFFQNVRKNDCFQNNSLECRKRL